MERKDFEEKLSLAQINKVVDTVRRDIANRKTFVDAPFNATSSLTPFIDDLRTETMARQGWEKLLNVKTTKGETLSILDHFNSITEAELKAAKTKRTPEEYNLSKICTLPYGAR